MAQKSIIVILENIYIQYIYLLYNEYTISILLIVG